MKLDYVNQLFRVDDYENIFQNFNFDLLNQPEFKEDAVREEIVYPILKLLGYSASNKNKIIRSLALKHPFYYFGTKKYNVNIIPDYTFYVEGKHKWILDAKSPTQNIVDGKNVYQAYSYAMHPEIQSNIYCLCNGKEFSVFDTKIHKPILHFKIENLKENWEELKNCLSPEVIKNPIVKSFSYDLGLFLLKIGDINLLTQPLEFICKEIDLIAKINDNLFTIVKPYCILGYDGEEFMGSFDFNKKQYIKLLSLLPNQVRSEIDSRLTQSPFKMKKDKPSKSPFKIIASVGQKIITNDFESYLPFKVVRFENL